MILVLGDAMDARGMALAGAKVVHCRTRDDVLGSLHQVEGGVVTPAMVMVSAPVYAMARGEVEAFRDRRRGPIVLVLPETEA
jgi:vacuolar-type H+-ATPase subunit F/Vma7